MGNPEPVKESRACAHGVVAAVERVSLGLVRIQFGLLGLFQ